MKKYRLKQWYPRLAVSWITDDRYEYDADRQVMTNISNVKNGLAIPKEMVVKEHEIHPDFWELIEEKKPLFVTEDGVSIFRQDVLLTVVFSDFSAGRYLLGDILNFPLDDLPYKDIKVFSNDDSAIDYTWKNKRLFSYEDILTALISIMPKKACDMMAKIAKERSKQ